MATGEHSLKNNMFCLFVAQTSETWIDVAEFLKLLTFFHPALNQRYNQALKTNIEN